MHLDLSENPESASVSVGKLGVISLLELHIEPDYCMPGSIRRQTEHDFLARLRTVQGPWGIKRVQDQGQRAWQLLWLLRSRLVSDSQNLI